MLSFAIAGLLLGSPKLQSDSSWYKVKLNVPNEASLNRLQNSDLRVLDCVPHIGLNDVAVGPGEAAKLRKSGFSFTYGGPIEDPTNWGERHPHSGDASDYRHEYFNADEILAFFESLRAQYPTIVSRISIGTSINGETIWAYRFSGIIVSPNSAREVVIESLIHAREWITGSTSMHIAKRITEWLQPNGPRFMVNQVVWIVPIINPDGYRYTWSTDRLWRKNRRHNSGGSYGVDVNRNFSVGFGQNGGSSSTQGSETYKGTAAFSEPESQAMRGLIQSLPRIDGFIDYHSYAQKVLQPWGYTNTVPPDNAALDAMGAAIAADMSVYGAIYTHGQTSQILYIASGTSNDWVYGTYGKPGLGIELRDTGDNGFLLPEDQISATQDEVWDGFRRYLNIIGH